MRNKDNRNMTREDSGRHRNGFRGNTGRTDKDIREHTDYIHTVLTDKQDTAEHRRRTGSSHRGRNWRATHETRGQNFRIKQEITKHKQNHDSEKFISELLFLIRISRILKDSSNHLGEEIFCLLIWLKNTCTSKLKMSSDTRYQYIMKDIGHILDKATRWYFDFV